MRRIALLLVFFALARSHAGDNETARFLGAEPEWARIELRTIDTKKGALHVAVCASGSVCFRLISTAQEERRFLFTIEKKDALALVNLAVEQDLLSAKQKERQGLPDEGRIEVLLENALGETRAVRRWSGDDPLAAGKVEAALEALEKKAEAKDAAYVGKQEAFYRPFAGVQVTIALMMGRPDPTFELVRPADWEKLLELTKDLEAAPRPDEKERPQGYHGFLLGPRALPALPKWISVSKGTVQLGDSPRDRVYKKDSRGLEDWLKAEAKKRGLATEAPR
jgi:hypothetical protein